MRIFRTGLLLIVMSVLLVVAGGALAGQRGMEMALIFAVLINGVSYFFSDKIALRSSGAQPVTREQLPRLYEVMERLAAKANIPVTKGLLQVMNDDELEGVIAHELSHVRNYDILTSSIAATIAGAITYMAQMGKWGMIFGGFGGGRDDDRGGGGLSALLMLFLAPFAALLLQLFLSRTREYA